MGDTHEQMTVEFDRQCRSRVRALCESAPELLKLGKEPANGAAVWQLGEGSPAAAHEPIALRTRAFLAAELSAPFGQPAGVDLVVRRGFSEGGEGRSTSFDFGDDVVDGLGPHEGLRVVVPA